MRLFCQRASQEPCGNQIRSTETWLINIHQLVVYIIYHSIHNNTHLVVVWTVGGLLDRGVLLTLAHGDADHGVHVEAGQLPRLDDGDADLGQQRHYSLHPSAATHLVVLGLQCVVPRGGGLRPADIKIKYNSYSIAQNTENKLPLRNYSQMDPF